MPTPHNKNNGGVLWQDELRKLGGEQLVTVLTEIRDSQCNMGKRINGLENGIGKAIEEHVKMAFAGSDPEGHRRAHEVMIEMLEERRKLVAAVKEKTISGLFWALAIWMGIAIPNQIRHAIGIPPIS